MSTQGVCSVVRGGRVTVKVVTGCDGFNIPKLAEAFREMAPVTAQEAYDAAEACGVGCEDCLVVMTDEETLFHGGDDLFPRYRATFADPRFNPRWDIGTAPYVEVVEAPAFSDATP
jgi:hypothetical protein